MNALDKPVEGGSFGETALIQAVGRKNRAEVERLLAAGASINQKSHWEPGGFGVLDRDLDSEWIDWLISKGAVMDAYSAARHGRIEVLRKLIAEDPSVVHWRGGDGQTPLHVAPSVEVAKLLLENGAAIDALDVDHESTPVMYLLKDHPEVARYLVSRGAKTDIFMAAALGDLELVRKHLGADPNAIRSVMTSEAFPMKGKLAFGTIYIWQIGFNKTPHAVARDNKHPEVYAELMKRTPDDLKLAIAAELGDEPLMKDILSRNPGVLKTLSAEAKRRLVDAVQDENVEGVRRLLGLGWPVDAVGQHGATALHWAAWHGSMEMAKELLKHKPPLDARDKDFGGTPASWARYASVHGWHPRRGDYRGLEELLVANGAAPVPND